MDKASAVVNEERRKAIFEYVCFIADSTPEDKANMEKFGGVFEIGDF